MSTHTRPTAREHIAQIAAEHGWTVTRELFTGINTVGDMIDRDNEVILVTWAHEGRAAVDIKLAEDGAPLAPIKGARAMGLINLRAHLEAPVSA